MKQLAVLLALVAAFAGAVPPPAHAGSSEDAALALGSFAVLNQLLRGETILHDIFGRRREVVRETVIVREPPPRVVYAPPPTVIYTPPPIVYGPPGHYYVVPPGPRKHRGWHPNGRHHGKFKHKYEYEYERD